MNAQSLTFNQDPEAVTQGMEVEKECCWQPSRSCCLFRWYTAPMRELWHCFKCFWFHPINFAVALFLMIWDLTLLSVGFGLIFLCCMGIPLLWITFETIVNFSYLDLGVFLTLFVCFCFSLRASDHIYKACIITWWRTASIWTILGYTCCRYRCIQPIFLCVSATAGRITAAASI